MNSGLCLGFVVLALSGCAIPVSNYVPTSRDISEPPTGAVAVSNVGDEMLKQGRFSEHDALVLSIESKVGWSYTLSPGVYLKRGQDQENQYFMPGPPPDGGHVDKAPLADPWRAIAVRSSEPGACIVTASNLVVCSPIPYTIEKRAVLTQNSFQQTLIYSGKSGNKINIGYREFSNNAARPAFSNNVDYDLSESKLIGYKGAQLEVIEATNQLIRYRVIRNFNAAP